MNENLNNPWNVRPPAPKPAKKSRKGCVVGLSVAGGFVLLVVILMAAFSNPKPVSTIGSGPTATAPSTWGDPTDGQATQEPAPAPTTEAAAPELPPQVEQAVGSAQDYLGFKAFSHDGLIDQLSSSYADDYPKDVATQAVDSLTVDWNAQAAKAAQDYLDFKSFSCSGLISQLSSDYADQFTKAEATYGAHQTSACK